MEKRFSVRITEKELIEFANKQSNLNDSIKYLIEKEIAQNGIRNLQEYVPAKRDINYFSKIKEDKNE